MMECFCAELRKMPNKVDYFDEGAWFALCNYITVYDKDDFRVMFRNGVEIQVLNEIFVCRGKPGSLLSAQFNTIHAFPPCPMRQCIPFPPLSIQTRKYPDFL